MSEKFPLITDHCPELCVKLEQYRVIDIAGADAEKYLQGQLTCDVSKLEIGQQTLTCHCDPKGKMSALFRLYRQSHSEFVAIMPADLLPEALQQLKKYAVFSKVSFTEQDCALYGTTSGQILADFREKMTACTLNALPNQPERHLLWGNETLETTGESANWDLLDIQQGIPLLARINQFELIPQAANLQALDCAISFTKGCYIGQETVARAKYRGANKRALFTLAGTISEGGDEWTLPEAGGSVELQIEQNWKSTGTILAAQRYQNHLWLQVVMNKEIDEASVFRCNGVALAIMPLPYSLAEN